MKSKVILLALACALPFTTALFAQDAASDEKAAAAELAKKLQNPIASLISVPIQNNWDFGIGSANAMKYTANIQPVIPFSLSQDWNLITRTIMPLIYAESPAKGGTDIPVSATSRRVSSFRPKRRWSGWIWGAGRCCFIPRHGRLLGSRHWGAGPTALALQQVNGWTFGCLANHIWSYARPAATARPMRRASDGSDAGSTPPSSSRLSLSPRNSSPPSG